MKAICSLSFINEARQMESEEVSRSMFAVSMHTALCWRSLFSRIAMKQTQSNLHILFVSLQHKVYTDFGFDVTLRVHASKHKVCDIVEGARSPVPSAFLLVRHNGRLYLRCLRL